MTNMAPQSSSIPSNATTANLVHDFIEKWSPGGSNHGFSEKAGAQQHFIELCAVLGVPTPDHQSDYTFELATIKLGGDLGFADVFKRQAFGWENKAPGGDLKAALKQLKMYASALDNPPLLIVSDRLRIQIHTQFTGTPTVSEEIWLKDLADPAVRERLRKCWTDPDFFKPKLTSRDITQKAADAFASVAERMREERHLAPERVSHFLTQCLFCFFAEDVGLLPEKLFDRLVSKQMLPEKLRASLIELFGKMRDGGLFGVDDIPWFNGGLFKTIDVPELTPMDISALRNAATENWSAIDVSIFGTLFERGLNPKKRSQLGAHYTDSKTIMRVIEPVVQRPLLAEWAEVKALIQKDINRAINLKDDSAAKKARRQAEAHFQTWLERLKNYRLLDPACGSGNFLYLGLKTLKDIELQTHIEAESLGVQRPVDMVTSPANVLGIELDE
ncbi:MAG: type IIL restriction-modification enzyme MmeI, partial [Casimicrobium sp.]